jgi:hypothetical protein
LEAWEKVFVSDEEFAASLHHQPNCIVCHAGVGEVATKEEAHVGLVRDPSAEPEKVCGACHADVVQTSSNSLHFGLQGYQTILEAPGG